MLTPVIAPLSTYTFRIRIVATSNRRLLIGVANSDIINLESSVGTYNSIGYIGLSSRITPLYIYNPNANIGSGFKVNDILTVVTNRSNHTVQWLVNDTLQAEYTNSTILGNASANFVPNLQMFDTNDIVEWL